MTSRHRPNPAGRAIVLGVLVAALLVVGGFVLLRATSRPGSVRLGSQKVGPRFVGDAQCAGCHREISESFRRHPMGRSIVPIAEAPGYGSEPVRFEAGGLVYEAESRDGRLIHRESLRDASGQVVGMVEGIVRFAMGSGTRGVSYLVEREAGSLLQSPIAWYTQGGRYDLAPGYEVTNQHFERPILPECLYCHADRAEAVPGSLNRYAIETVGHPISCERCHGPGEDHVRLTGATDEDGRPTIINPGNLEPSLREAVCEQCHLMGEVRVNRAGRVPEEFRPGRLLDEVVAVFVRPAGGRLRNRSIGHFEQMHASRCYQASGGRLGCVSCHDPHAAPGEETKAVFYRGRCLNCHQDRGCSLPESQREAKRNDCTACHMPRSGLTDIVHTAATMHHIPRTPGREPVGASPDEDLPDLVHFHPDRLKPAERTANQRDLGVALAIYARNLADRARAAELGELALSLLAEALRVRPDDPEGWEARSTALYLMGHAGSALDALAQALKHQPDRDSALIQAASMAGNLGRSEEARRYVERLLAVNPSRAQHHAILAVLNAHEKRWDEAGTAARAALSLDPAHVEARRVLIEQARAMGLPTRAAEQQRVLDLYQSPDR
jgi:Tfp pilus assembly protein PilF